MGPFLFHDEPETCEKKMTTQRLSQGCHSMLKVVIRLSLGCHNGSHWIAIRLSVKQSDDVLTQRLSVRQAFDNLLIL